MSKERELLKGIMSYVAKGDITIRKFENSSDVAETLHTAQELLTQPETCVCQERQLKLSEKCRELEIEIGRKEARMPVGMRSITPANQQGIAQMAHMCSDAEYADFIKRIGLDE